MSDEIRNAPFGWRVAAGNVLGFLNMNKFGSNPSIQSAVDADVWDYGSHVGAEIYTYDTAAQTLYISSSAGGDTQDYEIQGLDENWDLQTVTQAAAGQTKTEVGTGVTWMRVFRIKNKGTTNNAGSIYVYIDDTIGSGVPDTEAKVRAHIDIGNNQTLMSIYTIPNGYIGLLHEWWTSLAAAIPANATATPKLFVRPFGEVFQLKDIMGLALGGASHDRHCFQVPNNFAAKSDIKVQVDVSVNATAMAAGFGILLDRKV